MAFIKVKVPNDKKNIDKKVRPKLIEDKKI